MNAHVTSRLLTFFVAGAAAVLATFALPKKSSGAPSDPG
jgi:hypothetical protein